mmetsp:Transcript_4800/g.13232  ORF Transcript_4800/g.13232 Transcript_4800/m.13232 type:complete len:352 (-) Transcript_4800:579-1634(-)
MGQRGGPLEALRQAARRKLGRGLRAALQRALRLGGGARAAGPGLHAQRPPGVHLLMPLKPGLRPAREHDCQGTVAQLAQRLQGDLQGPAAERPGPGRHCVGAFERPGPRRLGGRDCGLCGQRLSHGCADGGGTGAWRRGCVPRPRPSASPRLPCGSVSAGDAELVGPPERSGAGPPRKPVHLCGAPWMPHNLWLFLCAGDQERRGRPELCGQGSALRHGGGRRRELPGLCPRLRAVRRGLPRRGGAGAPAHGPGPSCRERRCPRRLGRAGAQRLRPGVSEPWRPTDADRLLLRRAPRGRARPGRGVVGALRAPAGRVLPAGVLAQLPREAKGHAPDGAETAAVARAPLPGA